MGAEKYRTFLGKEYDYFGTYDSRVAAYRDAGALRHTRHYNARVTEERVGRRRYYVVWFTDSPLPKI